MMVKYPSRRISQLDLKFLEQHFVPIQRKIIRGINTNSSFNSSNHCQQTGIYQHSNGSTLSPKGKQLIGLKNQQGALNIADLNSTAASEQHITPKNNEHIMRYLSMGLATMYREVGSRKFHLQPSKSQMSRKQRNELDKKQEIDKYNEMIRHYEKENTEIHSQIIRIYTDLRKENKQQVRSIKQMQIVTEAQSGKLPAIKKLGNQIGKAVLSRESSIGGHGCQEGDNKDKRMWGYIGKQIRYGRQAVGKFLEGRQQYNKNNEKQLRSAKSRILGKQKAEHSNPKKYSQKLDRHQSTNLPKLAKIYHYFYQKLYDSHSNNLPSTNHNHTIQHEQNKQIQNYYQFKKMMSNKNRTIHKNFEEFLIKKKKRIPEFLRNIQD